MATKSTADYLKEKFYGSAPAPSNLSVSDIEKQTYLAGAANVSIADLRRAQSGKYPITPSVGKSYGDARYEWLSGAGASGVSVTDSVILRRTTNQAINNAPISVVFNAEDSDASNYWVSGSPSRVTVPVGKGGNHLMTLTWAFDGGTDRSFGDLVPNVGGVSRTFRSSGGVGGEDTGHNTIMTKLGDGDYVDIIVFQPRTGNLVSARFEMVRLG